MSGTQVSSVCKSSHTALQIPWWTPHHAKDYTKVQSLNGEKKKHQFYKFPNNCPGSLCKTMIKAGIQNVAKVKRPHGLHPESLLCWPSDPTIKLWCEIFHYDAAKEQTSAHPPVPKVNEADLRRCHLCPEPGLSQPGLSSLKAEIPRPKRKDGQPSSHRVDQGSGFLVVSVDRRGGEYKHLNYA